MIEVLEQDMPKIKRMANKLVKMLGDEAQSLEFVRQQKLEGKLETARQMLADGVPLDRIHKYTGLSIKELKALTPES